MRDHLLSSIVDILTVHFEPSCDIRPPEFRLTGEPLPNTADGVTLNTGDPPGNGAAAGVFLTISRTADHALTGPDTGRKPCDSTNFLPGHAV